MKSTQLKHWSVLRINFDIIKSGESVLFKKYILVVHKVHVKHSININLYNWWLSTSHENDTSCFQNKFPYDKRSIFFQIKCKLPPNSIQFLNNIIYVFIYLFYTFPSINIYVEKHTPCNILRKRKGIVWTLIKQNKWTDSLESTHTSPFCFLFSNLNILKI